jgi:hypothetical protein
LAARRFSGVVFHEDLGNLPTTGVRKTLSLAAAPS